jgi:hypothetical protein
VRYGILLRATVYGYGVPYEKKRKRYKGKRHTARPSARHIFSYFDKYSPAHVTGTGVPVPRSVPVPGSVVSERSRLQAITRVQATTARGSARWAALSVCQRVSPGGHATATQHTPVMAAREHASRNMIHPSPLIFTASFSVLRHFPGFRQGVRRTGIDDRARGEG